ncbi:MAG: hypothetical protein ACI845_002942 [Gammaproteobacteria bacterium]|jgi:hypothetical protein
MVIATELFEMTPCIDTSKALIVIGAKPFITVKNNRP